MPTSNLDAASAIALTRYSNLGGLDRILCITVIIIHIRILQGNFKNSMADFNMITAFSSPRTSGRAYTVACSAEDTARDITESICSKYHLKVKPSQVNLHLLPACSLWAGELEPGNSPLIGGDINVASRLLGGRGSSTLLWSVGDSIREEENQTARKDAALFSKSSMLAPSPCLEARGSDHSVSSDERTRSVYSKPLEVKESSLSTAANRRDRITNERVSSSETD